MKKMTFILVAAIVLGLMIGSLSLAYAKGPLGPKTAAGSACTPSAACPTSGAACAAPGRAKGGCPQGSGAAKPATPATPATPTSPAVPATPAAPGACGGACSAQ